MKKVPKSLVLAFFAAWMITFAGCKKKVEIPTLTTIPVSSITATSAETGGIVSSDGGVEVIAKGVCWGTAHNPTVYGSKTIDGPGSGSFSSAISGLTGSTSYFVRAYATNSAGTAYGNEISFISYQIALATVTTSAITDITLSSALSGVNINSNGGSTLTDWGLCWSTLTNPTTGNDKISLSGGNGGTGIFVSSIPDLSQGTTYYVRAYAVNSAGTAYGNEISFSTLFSVTTSGIISFTTSSAVITGNIIYGQNGVHLIGSGVCWSTSRNPTTSDNEIMNVTYSGIFTTELTGLSQGTTYFVRAFALYENGPAIYGNELSFTTSFEPGTGIQKADFPGGARYNASGFSIGTKVYLGLGTSDGDKIFKDFWEWDQASNVWTRKADYPGNGSFGSVGFSIGTKGYIGTGGTNEFWEFDPLTNTWTQKSSMPGNGTWGRIYAAGFSIGTKGYIGTGSLGLGNNSESRDFWEWDQATNVWTQKADFGGTARKGAVGFSIGNKGYIGTGSGNGTAYKDIWEWDQTTNVWTRKADFGGTSRVFAVGFSMGNKGYLGTGVSGDDFFPIYFQDFWEWDQITNVWTQKHRFAGGVRALAVGLSVGNKAYLGTGITADLFDSVLQDFWEYDPALK